MRIGIFPNLVKRESAAIVQQMIKICEKHGIEYYLPAYVSESRQPAYQRIGAEHLRPRMTIYSTIDVAMILGGDGTILKMAKQFAEADVPVCGINLGSWASSTKSRPRPWKSAWKTSWPAAISWKNG